MSDILAYVDLFKDDLDAFEAMELDAWETNFPNTEGFKKLPDALRDGLLAAPPGLVLSLRRELEQFIKALNDVLALTAVDLDDPTRLRQLYEMHAALERAKDACAQLAIAGLPRADIVHSDIGGVQSAVRLEIVQAEKDRLKRVEEAFRQRAAERKGLMKLAEPSWSPPPAQPKTPPSRSNELRRMAKGDKSWKR